MKHLFQIKYKLNKLEIGTIIVVALLFFSFSVPAFAMDINLSNLFDFSFLKKVEAPLVTKNSAGSIDYSVNNKVKVCKDVTCTNPKPGIIDFGKSPDNSPLKVDSVNGISGDVFGGELGIINFQPPYGGVYFANPATGLLEGTAWSETSGSINFSVTGQKVIINPKTGEWSGWAWASGPYGGWIKFDCNTGSCVKTTWRYTKPKPQNKTKTITTKDSSVTAVVSVAINSKSNNSNTSNTIIKKVLKAKEIIVISFKGIYLDTLSFFSKIGQTVIKETKTASSDFNTFSSDSFSKVGNVIIDAYNSVVKSISNMKIKIPNFQQTNK